MKIENLRSERSGNRARVSATVKWEDCDRPTQDIYFETVEAFAQDLSCNPHAFLNACAIPAMHYGEKRVWMDAEVCPELRTGLEVAMGWIRNWYYEPDRETVQIETKTRSSLATPQAPDRAGLFFSGGIDAVSTLRANRLSFSSEHPRSIKDGLLVYGLELDEPQAFEYVLDSMSRMAEKIGITLIPVYTNVYLNYRQEDKKEKWRFWSDEFEGAVLSTVAHAFTKRLSTVSITSTFDIPNLHPHGSHPLIDPNYSSSDLQIRHEGTSLSRFERTKLVADWDVALQEIRVCNGYSLYRPGMLNCGKCEKCIRTMLALLALGVLKNTLAFPKQEISEELLISGIIMNKTTSSFYAELLSPLAEIGRYDLVRAIEHKIAEYHKRQKINKRNVKIKRFDSKYLNSTLFRLKRAILH